MAYLRLVIAVEQVRLAYASPDGAEIERPDETKQRKAWTL